MMEMAELIAGRSSLIGGRGSDGDDDRLEAAGIPVGDFAPAR